MKKAAAFLSALLTILPVSSSAWVAENRFLVEPLDDGVIEVVSRRGADARDFWCGAGGYARHIWNTPATQRIYLVRERGPAVTRNRVSAVHFSLTPPEGVDLTPGWLISVTRVGDSMIAGEALNHCWDRKLLGH